MKAKTKLYVPMCALKGETPETIKTRAILNRELARIAEETNTKIAVRSGGIMRSFFVLAPSGKWLKTDALLPRNMMNPGDAMVQGIVSRVHGAIARSQRQHVQIDAIKRLANALMGLSKGVATGPMSLRIMKPGNMVPVIAVKAETGHTYSATLSFSGLTATDIEEMVRAYEPWWGLNTSVIDTTEGI